VGGGGGGGGGGGAGGVDRGRVGAVSVVFSGEVGAGHVDTQGLVVRGLGRGHVAQSQLVVDLVLRVVAPGRVVQGELRVGGRLRRRRGGGGGAGSSLFVAVDNITYLYLRYNYDISTHKQLKDSCKKKLSSSISRKV